MLDNPLVDFDTAALLLSMVISALASYRAFNSRNVLASPLYRSRALWTGSVALITILFDFLAIVLENSTPTGSISGSLQPSGSWEFLGFVALVAAGAIVVFAWIDRTIGVALELDFLHRDAIGWKRLRLFAGTAIVVGAIGAEVLVPEWEFLLSILLLAVPAAYMAGALVVGGSRVKDDTMRRYMKWMGLIVASLILQLATASIPPYLNFPLAIFAYFLYRASTSLLKTSPLRLATSEIPPASSPGVPSPDLGRRQAPG